MQLKHDFELFATGCTKWMDGEQNALETTRLESTLLRLLPPAKQNRRLSACFVNAFDGVADGTRTHDDRNHNPGLYQLSYSHHCYRFLFFAAFVFQQRRTRLYEHF